MADIEKLAASAMKVKENSDKSVGMPLAVVKAIRGQGITNPADVNRLKTEVLARLRENAKEKRATTKAAPAPVSEAPKNFSEMSSAERLATLHELRSGVSKDN